MVKRATILLGLLLKMIALPAAAQSWGNNPMLNRLQATRVQSLNEFIHRFNADEVPDFIPRSDSASLRELCLAALFDIEGLTDNRTIATAQAFIQSTVGNAIFLGLHDSAIYAEAHCLFLHQGRKVAVDLVLQRGEVLPNVWQWYIVGTHGLFKAGLIDTTSRGALSPVQHEMNFMHLNEAFPQMYSYTSRSVHVDQLSYLMALAAAGTLTYHSCTSITYHCYAVPGYLFTIIQKNRLAANSGWLISSVVPMDDVAKQMNVNQLLGKL